MAEPVRVFCQCCGQSYKLDASKIPAEGKNARCKTCRGVFVVAPPGSDLPQPGTGGPWKVRVEEDEEGDLNLAEVRNRIRYDQLYPEDLVFPPGAGDWMQADAVPVLKKYFRMKQGQPAASVPPAAAPADGGRFRCVNHSSVDAVHVCSACQKYYCAECVDHKEVQNIRIPLCPSCGEAVDDFEQKEDVKPFWQDLDMIFRFPFRSEGLVTVIIFVVLYTGSLLLRNVPLGGLAANIVWLPLAAYLLNLISEAADGVTTPPDFPELSEMWDDMIIPALKLLVASLLPFGPLVLYVFLAWDLLLTQPVLFMAGIGLLVLLGLFIYPMVLAILGVWNSLVPSMNPVLVLRLIARIPGPYFIYLGFWYGGWILVFILRLVAENAVAPLRLVIGPVEAYTYLVLFFMLGRMCYQCEDKLAWE